MTFSPTHPCEGYSLTAWGWAPSGKVRKVSTEPAGTEDASRQEARQPGMQQHQDALKRGPWGSSLCVAARGMGAWLGADKVAQTPGPLILSKARL